MAFGLTLKRVIVRIRLNVTQSCQYTEQFLNEKKHTFLRSVLCKVLANRHRVSGKMLGRCRSGGGSADVVCLQLLVVYPAADCEFQHVVTVLAEFLQDCGNVRVVIDIWERERVAEQGLIRWIHTQSELADIILFILPPHHAHSGMKTHLFVFNAAQMSENLSVY